MRHLVMLFAAIAAAPASAQVQQFRIRPFTEVSAAGPFDVTVTTGSAASATAEGSPADLARIEVRNDGRDLEIRPRRGVRPDDLGRIRVRVTSANGVREVSAAGTATLSLDRADRTGFEANNAGSGRVDIAGANVANIELSNAGTGSIRAAGQCTRGEFSNAGSGSIDAGALRCATLSINTAGSGNVSAYATRNASVSSMGSGTVNVRGGARCSTTRVGSRQVNCRP